MINHDKDRHSSPFWSIGYLLQRQESMWQWTRRTAGDISFLFLPAPQPCRQQLPVPQGAVPHGAAAAPNSPSLESDFRCCCPDGRKGWLSSERLLFHTPSALKKFLLQTLIPRGGGKQSPIYSPRLASGKLREKGCTTLSYHRSEIPTSPPTKLPKPSGLLIISRKIVGWSVRQRRYKITIKNQIYLFCQLNYLVFLSLH